MTKTKQELITECYQYLSRIVEILDEVWDNMADKYGNEPERRWLVSGPVSGTSKYKNLIKNLESMSVPNLIIEDIIKYCSNTEEVDYVNINYSHKILTATTHDGEVLATYSLEVK